MRVLKNEDLNYVYQCFFDGGVCLLVNEDFSETVKIESEMYDEDKPFEMTYIPSPLIEIAVGFNLLVLH